MLVEFAEYQDQLSILTSDSRILNSQKISGQNIDHVSDHLVLFFYDREIRFEGFFV